MVIVSSIVLLFLVQVAGLQVGPEFAKEFEKLYRVFIQQLQVVLPQGTNIPVAYEHGSDEEQAFVQNLALFFTAFFKVNASTPTSHYASGVFLYSMLGP